MGGFIYAIPKITSINEKILADTGLDKVLKEVVYFTREGLIPQGQQGILIGGRGIDSKQLYYKPDEQNWQRSLNEKYHIGLYVNEKPGPADLTRKEQIDGYEILLSDGNKWMIPLARAFPAGTSLPQSLIMGSDGKLTAELMPKFLAFSKKAEKLWNDFLKIFGLEEGKPEMTIEQAWDMTVEALNFNYHISTDEINILKLIDSKNIWEICKAVIDYPAIEEYLKKNSAEKQPSDSGSAAE